MCQAGPNDCKVFTKKVSVYIDQDQPAWDQALRPAAASAGPARLKKLNSPLFTIPWFDQLDAYFAYFFQDAY